MELANLLPARCARPGSLGDDKSAYGLAAAGLRRTRLGAERLLATPFNDMQYIAQFEKLGKF